MSRIYVIAGEHDVAYRRWWINQEVDRRFLNGDHTVSRRDYVIVHDRDTLRGVRNPTGFFIGVWKERKDLYELLSILLVCMDFSNPSKNIIQSMLVDLIMYQNKQTGTFYNNNLKQGVRGTSYSHVWIDET
jgi:hypothetical protein